ncbi:uncharacterized protein DFL_004434 [Arthrobotrys flagrans]|uniref:Uncharacterized protein n=1 Tax=Arthrobotrys flagrans TaxID=97331 RepID=A0A437A4N7_ARTFL|nr:hypothetical protein DFL_004434 [Arthrobotrys flagrans]
MTLALKLRLFFLLWIFNSNIILAFAEAESAQSQVDNNGEQGNKDYSLEASGNFDQIFKIQQTYLTVQVDELNPTNTPRARDEKRRLLKELSRGHGKWGDQHPRKKLLDALFSYGRYFERNKPDVDRWSQLYNHVSSKHKRLLDRTISYTQKFAKVERLLRQNHMLCEDIVNEALSYYEIGRDELRKHIADADKAGIVADKMSVSQSLKHIGRDWTDDGVNERNSAFPCILDSIQSLFPKRQDKKYKVLLPGSGLGRLGYEVAALGGFEVTNNEVSAFMNVMYRFIEAQHKRNAFQVYPFVDGWSHHATQDDMFYQLSFPSMTMNNSNVALVEGDFTTVFKGSKDKFDVIITHFFIDTARNIMNYFETISSLLSPGGYWINFGPLLYGTGPWVQLTLDEILAVTEAMGFQFVDAPQTCGALTFPGRKRLLFLIPFVDARRGGSDGGGSRDGGGTSGGGGGSSDTTNKCFDSRANQQEEIYDGPIFSGYYDGQLTFKYRLTKSSSETMQDSTCIGADNHYHTFTYDAVMNIGAITNGILYLLIWELRAFAPWVEDTLETLHHFEKFFV